MLSDAFLHKATTWFIVTKKFIHGVTSISQQNITYCFTMNKKSASLRFQCEFIKMPQLANQQLVGPQRKLRVSQGLYKCGFE